jgi:hypothetical protein
MTKKTKTNQTAAQGQNLREKGIESAQPSSEATTAHMSEDTLARKTAKLCNDTGGYATKFAEDEFYQIIKSAFRQLETTRKAHAERLAAALRDVFVMIDTGLLVRDISEDHKPDWAMRQLKFVQRLATDQAALEEWRKASK